MTYNDTIVAISTSTVRAAIGIVRLSGKESLNILNKVFRSYKGQISSFKITYGEIFNNFTQEKIDEVLVSFMKAPNSYTKEDVIEINCHGNPTVLEYILNLVTKNGARLAEPGEFTKRAFLNGRIDLTQAESIFDLINSKSNQNLSLSLKNMEGKLKNKVREFKEKIIDVISEINVVSDYPEEVEDIIDEETIIKVQELKERIKYIIDSYDKGKKIKEGIKLAIIGKPNVGKSSILNKLLKTERAIVTEIPGTTRDIIEETLLIKGLPIVIQDTAGIRESTVDPIEKIGINLSKNSIEASDIIIFVLDSSKNLSEEDIEIFKLIKDKKVVYILNKRDLKNEMDISPLSLTNFIYFSSYIEEDIAALEEAIYKEISQYYFIPKGEEILLDNLRHKILFEKCYLHLNNFLSSTFNGITLDIALIDLKASLDSLSEIVGEITNEDILDNIFKNFCVGK